MKAVGEGATGGVAHRALGLFITRVVRHFPDGSHVVLNSRSHRKGLRPRRAPETGTSPRFPRPRVMLWAPERMAWWIAVLFLIGSALFAVASVASNWPHAAPRALTSPAALGWVFFIGSIFFTSAATLQLLESINGDVADSLETSPNRRAWRWFAWKPHSAAYLSCLTQFVGTLLFNLNTGAALMADLTWEKEEILIWVPDTLGSVLFLVSSQLAVMEVSHTLWSFKPRLISWWIVAVNLLGSVAFMVAAVFSFYSPGTGEPEWVWGANLFTLVGAIGFFVGAGLMIPELSGVGVPGEAVAPRSSRDEDQEP